MGCLNIEGGFFGELVQKYIFGVVGWGVTFFGELALQIYSPKKPTPQPGAQKRASSEVPTHQKKLLPNHLLKKVVLKGQLTKKATSQPATKKGAQYKEPTHKKSFFTTIYLKK